MTPATQAKELPDEIPPDVRNEIHRYVKTLPDDASCIVTGSIVEGIGNINSDIDLYIIQQAGSFTPKPIAIGIRESRYMDLEFLSDQTVRRLAEKFADPAADVLQDLNDRDFDRYYRIAIGIPLVAEDWVHDILPEFTVDRSRALFSRKAMVRAYHHLARGAVAHAMGQTRGAQVLLREAALWRATSVLADAGEGYPSIKWAEVKAARHFGAGTAQYTACLSGYLDSSPDTTTHLSQARERIPLTDDVRQAFPDQPWELAENVQVITDGDAQYLVRGAQSVARVSGVVALVISELAAGAPWTDATANIATKLQVSRGELGAAASAVLRELGRGGYLHRSAGEVA
ncbi:hypothetical protein [Catellatospora sichuanensis]|uniref:hypothetical protein n=1 Tax=Catellatospora sichuanensis TaxID=1969805 RepID=UPI00118360E0|nr:hypothetical protein [Catellatospora sichuanensis]